MTEPKYLKPLLFDRLDGEGVVTLNLDDDYYGKAQVILDEGYWFGLRALSQYRFELSVRDPFGKPVSQALSVGWACDVTAEGLIDYAIEALSLWDELA